MTDNIIMTGDGNAVSDEGSSMLRDSVSQPKASLGDPQSAGGPTALKGFDFQRAYALTLLVESLPDPEFTAVIVEGAEDVEARFDRAGVIERHAVQVKGYRVTLALAKKTVIAHFIELDNASPGTWKSFVIACTGLDGTLQAIHNLLVNYRDPQGFYDAEKDGVLADTRADLEHKITDAGLPVAFVIEHVTFEPGLPDLAHLEEWVRPRVLDTLQRAYFEMTHAAAEDAYRRLLVLVAASTREPITRGQAQAEIAEAIAPHLAARAAQGTMLDQQAINSIISQLGDAIVERLAKRYEEELHLDKQDVQDLGVRSVSENERRQIDEIVAAQEAAAASGRPATPEVAYRLGRLTASRRDYDRALYYFRQAAMADPGYSDAFWAIAWLQQSRAMHDIQRRDYDAAEARLAEAHRAVKQTDPSDPRALVLRGAVFKTLAQVAAARRKEYYVEAARLFEHAAQLDHRDASTQASAQLGLGNVQQALGNLDTAIAFYSRAVTLEPSYTAAYHDLAMAYEAKMEADPGHVREWCEKALVAWRKAYQLVQEDPGFPEDYHIQKILPCIHRLERRCG